MANEYISNINGYLLKDTEARTQLTNKVDKTYVDTEITKAKSYTDSKVASIVDSSPEALNTLNELAAALGDDPNFATTVTNQIAQKANKTEVYALNDQMDVVTNNFVDAFNRIGSLETTANSLHKVATSGSYNDLTNKPTIPAAVTVDSAMSSTSTNPVQNKVVNSALSGKTSTSILPNNSGEIKTKYRVAQKGDAGRTAGAYWYYKICDLPVNNDGNYASAIISGRIGGWTSGDMSYINALIWNRNTPGISLIDIAGGASAMSSIWNTCELVLYTNGTSATAANTATLYAKCYSWFTFDLDIEVFQSTASITYDGTHTTTTPSGTLAASSSTSTKRLELVGGKLYVSGAEMVTETRLQAVLGSYVNDIDALLGG